MDGRWSQQARTPGSDSRIDLTQISLESLAPVSASVGVLFLVFAVGDLLALPRAAAVRMSLAMAGTALVLFAVAIAVKRSAVPPRWAHAAGAGVAGLLVASNLLRLALTAEFEQTTYFFLLVIVGVGTFLLSTPWLAAVIAGTLAAWGVVVWTHPAVAIGPPSARVRFGLVVFAGVLLSALIHRQRVRTLRELERVRIRDQERNKELEAALEAVRESEERLNILFENAADAMFVTRLDGQLVRVNKQACRSLGYSRDELVGLNILDVDTSSAGDVDRIVSTLGPGDLLTLESTHRRKDGTTFPVEIRVARLATPEGPQVLGIARDITERERAERALKRRNRELRARHAVARALSGSLDLDDLLDDALSSTADALGFSAGVITLADEDTGTLTLVSQTGLPASFVESLEARGLQHSLCDVVYSEGESLSIGDLRREGDGNVEELLGVGLQAYVGSPIVRKGRVLGTLCLFHHEPRTFSEADSELLTSLGREIGMAVESARLFAQSRSRRLYLDAVLRAADDAIVTLDAHNQIVEWNPGAERLFGYSREEAIGKELDLLISAPEVREEAICLTRMTMQGERVSPTEAVRHRKDGSPVDVILAGSPIFIEGEFAGAVAVYTDISDLREAQEALRQHAADLEARNEELNAFAHTVAHDLKNPLQNLIGYTELLGEGYEDLPDEIREEALRTIVQSADRMNSIIEELLLLAAVRRGEVRSEPLEMGAIVAAAQDRLAYMIEEHDAQIAVPETWPTAVGHAAWVEEAWANYLSNAIKYGGDPPRVEVGASEQPDGMVRFWVRDNGRGLTAEEQARLFVPFTRLHQVRAEGQGLGLSIVRRIVDKLGGQVGIESEVGEGSTFFFTLPQA